jgi:hypothetical protein
MNRLAYVVCDSPDPGQKKFYWCPPASIAYQVARPIHDHLTSNRGGFSFALQLAWSTLSPTES